MIKFTVVTCTYNAGAVLQRTLDSVLRQSYGHVEHLVIDGVSTDNTLLLVEAYRKRNASEGHGHSVVVSSEPDKGLYDAMNKGIDCATGDYLVFLNAGDVFSMADTLAMVADGVDKKEGLPGVLYGDTDIVDLDGRFLRHRRLSPPAKLSWRSFIWGMLVCHQSFYARADIARSVHYDLGYRYSADVDWCIRVMKVAERRRLSLYNVHAVLTHFLDGGMTTQNHRASLKERFWVMRAHYGLVPTVLAHAWFVVRGIVKR